MNEIIDKIKSREIKEIGYDLRDLGPYSLGIFPIVYTVDRNNITTNCNKQLSITSLKDNIKDEFDIMRNFDEVNSILRIRFYPKNKGGK